MRPGIVEADDAIRFVVPSAPGKAHSDDTKVTDLLYLAHELASSKQSLDGVWETVTARLSESVAGDVAMVTELYADDPARFERIAATAYSTMGLSVDLREGDTLPTARRSAFFRALDRTLRRAGFDRRGPDPVERDGVEDLPAGGCGQLVVGREQLSQATGAAHPVAEHEEGRSVQGFGLRDRQVPRPVGRTSGGEEQRP